MDLIAGLNELIAQMEEDLVELRNAPDMRYVSGYVRSLKMLIKAASPKPTFRDDEGGASVSIGGSTQPQQPPPPSRPFRASRKPSDPWDEAQRRAASELNRENHDRIPRTREGVLYVREKNPLSGCCERFANNQACDCLEEAE